MSKTPTGHRHQNISETHEITKDAVISTITLYLYETIKHVFRCEFIMKDQTVHSEAIQVKYEGKWVPAQEITESSERYICISSEIFSVVAVGELCKNRI